MKQLVIIGGALSIKPAIEKGLWSKLDCKYVMGLNFSYRYFKTPTLQCFVDSIFYNIGDKGLTPEQKETHKKFLKNMKLIVGTGDAKSIKPIFPNTILLPSSVNYKRNLKGGVYKNSLVGIFALSLAIYLLDVGEIYLLGYDYGEARTKDYEKFITSPQQLNNLALKDEKNRYITHFYQGEINHRGIAKVAYYTTKGRAERDFKVYNEEKQVKIYNVSLVSKIPSSIFPKISYEEFFKKLDKNNYDQNKLREEIKKKIKEI